MKVRFHGNPIVEIIRDDLVRLNQPFFFTVSQNNNPEDDVTIQIPTGFFSDEASVPRTPGIYLTLGGRGRKAGIVHDYLYSEAFSETALARGYDREFADRVLMAALIADGMDEESAELFYFGVRIGGESHWQKPDPTGA